MSPKYLFALGLSAVVAAPALALDVKLDVAKNYYSSSDEVTVFLTVTNDSAQPVVLPRWFVPDGQLEEALFDVRRDGQAVDYLGPKFKRAPLSAADLVPLAAGASLTRAVKLSELYDMSGSGQYSVRYRVDTGRLMSLAAVRPAGRGDTSSNEVGLWVEGRRSAALIEAEQGRRMTAMLAQANLASVSFESCSTSQKNSVTQGVNAAVTMANSSQSYLNGAPSATRRYVTWFGKYSLSNWNVAKDHFNKIKDAVNNKPLVFNCGCTSSAYAYVYPDRPYKIYLCKAFWNAPTTGTDSKGGTIVHELAHFNVVAGTDDHAYGQTAAKNLATSSPTKALDNSDNHEYFAENTPSLP